MTVLRMMGWPITRGGTASAWREGVLAGLLAAQTFARAATGVVSAIDPFVLEVVYVFMSALCRLVTVVESYIRLLSHQQLRMSGIVSNKPAPNQHPHSEPDSW